MDDVASSGSSADDSSAGGVPNSGFAIENDEVAEVVVVVCPKENGDGEGAGVVELIIPEKEFVVPVPKEKVGAVVPDPNAAVVVFVSVEDGLEPNENPDPPELVVFSSVEVVEVVVAVFPKLVFVLLADASAAKPPPPPPNPGLEPVFPNNLDPPPPPNAGAGLPKTEEDDDPGVVVDVAPPTSELV